LKEGKGGKKGGRTETKGRKGAVIQCLEGHPTDVPSGGGGRIQRGAMGLIEGREVKGRLALG